MNFPNFLSMIVCLFPLMSGCGGGSDGGASASAAPPTATFASLGSPCKANGGDVNISVKASRTSGVAPLSVIFDATDTTAPARPFHNLIFSWNFGDTSAGAWSNGVNNLTSKNQATGAVAGHVFESAGVHTVSLTINNGGDLSKCVATLTVNVDSPDTYTGYAGAKTACIGRALPIAGLNGCPVGATAYVSDDAALTVDTVIKNALAGGSRRVLLQRGDTFSSSAPITASLPGPVMIGAYGGNSAKPVINMPVLNSYLFNLRNAPTDWRFSNIDLNGLGTNVKFSVPNGTNLSDHILFHKLTVRNSGGLSVGRTNVVVVDSQIGPITGGSGNNGVWASEAFGFYFAGNHINDTTAGEHGMRIQGAIKGAVNHNTFTNAAYTKQVFTLRGNDTVPFVTQYVVVSDNVFELTKPSGDNWMTTISPQNTTRKEEIRDILVERNLFRAVNGVSQALMISASDVTVRNNLFNQSNTISSINVFYDNIAGLSNPGRVHIYHNTFLSLSGANFSAVTVSAPTVSDINIRNNLAYSSSAYRDSSNNGSPTFLNNMATSGSVVSDSNTKNSDISVAPSLVNLNGDLMNPQNWALSSAILGSGGVVVQGTEEDFLRGQRNLKQDSAGALKIGLGAFQY